MICKCGKEFECHHEFNRGDMWFNHCIKCEAGAGYDLCKGSCPDCIDTARKQLKEEMDKMFNKPL